MTEIIMYESDEAATYRKNIEGWVSRNGRFCGKGEAGERAARYDGSTHRKCDCGNLMGKGWTKCEVCRAKLDHEKFEAMPFKKWEGEPLVLFDGDTYFFGEEDIENYADEHGWDALQMLVICEPVVAPYIEDYACDELADDMTLVDASQELSDMIDKFNKFISQNKPILSWREGKYRTQITKDMFEGVPAKD